VRNAADACEGAGVVPDVRIHGWVDVAHHSCRVSVEDNGPGIPQAARDRIFQPFFTTRSQGTGLGLAIVQKIVVMHNGRVTVADARGGGASIQLALPVADSRESTVAT
jgi:two-component system sensor histidine kinase FlrB